MAHSDWFCAQDSWAAPYRDQAELIFFTMDQLGAEGGLSTAQARAPRWLGASARPRVRAEHATSRLRCLFWNRLHRFLDEALGEGRNEISEGWLHKVSREERRPQSSGSAAESSRSPSRPRGWKHERALEHTSRVDAQIKKAPRQCCACGNDADRLWRCSCANDYCMACGGDCGHVICEDVRCSRDIMCRANRAMIVVERTHVSENAYDM
jgi:hypothetical protein